MKKEIMLIVVITIAGICIAAGLNYLLVSVPGQPVMPTAAAQGGMLVAADKIHGANKPEARNINNSSSNMQAFEKAVQEFRQKTSSLHINDAGTSISPSPENSRESVPAKQDIGGEENKRGYASTGQVSVRGPGYSSVPANFAFVTRVLPDAGPPAGPADDSRNRDEEVISGGPESGQADNPSSRNVSVSRSVMSGDSGKGEIKVTLSIYPGEVRPNGLIVKEYIPKGWEVRESTPAYRNYDPSTGEIKWLLMGNEIRSMEIGYTVVKKGTEETAAAFHGNYLYNGPDGQRVTMRIEDLNGV